MYKVGASLVNTIYVILFFFFFSDFAEKRLKFKNLCFYNYRPGLNVVKL